MKRAFFVYSFLLIFLSPVRPALGQTNTGVDAGKACPFSIVGVWRSDVTTQSNPVFFSFSPEGWVTLLGHSADSLPQDFEMIAEVRYKLDKPAAPRGIEFLAARGNDAFPAGATLLKILEYSDDSFTTLDPVTEQKTRWVKERTERYFLTFAARNTPGQGGPAFAMWTILDGRSPRVEALGIRTATGDAGKTEPTFGPIPAELYDRITEDEKKSSKDERSKDGNVIARFELTRAEFEATHKIYQAWEKSAKTNVLPAGDPYMNGMEFLRAAAEGLNPCGEKAKLLRPTQRERDEIASGFAPLQRPLEYIRLMRKKNEELHIKDVAFPWQWRPMIQSPAQ